MKANPPIVDIKQARSQLSREANASRRINAGHVECEINGCTSVVKQSNYDKHHDIQLEEKKKMESVTCCICPKTVIFCRGMCRSSYGKVERERLDSRFAKCVPHRHVILITRVGFARNTMAR